MIRKNNSCVGGHGLAKPSFRKLGQCHGMPSPDLARLVVTGMQIKYAKLWKAKLCYMLSMGNLIMFWLLLFRRYQVHLLPHHLHHLNGVSLVRIPILPCDYPSDLFPDPEFEKDMHLGGWSNVPQLTFDTSLYVGQLHLYLRFLEPEWLYSVSMSNRVVM